MVEKKKWTEFKDNGMLWLVNSFLHIFGWAIVFEMRKGVVVDIYPARVSYRGFSEQINTDEYKKLTNYMCENSQDLLSDFEDV